MYLCLTCRAKIEPKDDLAGCPNCGDSRGIPADTDQTVSVSITLHELRVLVMWAERWASLTDDQEHAKMRLVLYGIADALQLQVPDGVGLTFASELADLREQFGLVQQNVIREDHGRSGT